jgi:hypothetical protein
MILESQPLVELIIKELRILQGEITIAKSMYVQKEMPTPQSILESSNSPIKIMELAMQAHEQAKEFFDFMKVMDYNEGKFDAYIKILKHLGVEYNRNETE